MGANLHQSLVLGSSEYSEAEDRPRRLSRIKEKTQADGVHLSAAVPLVHAKHVVKHTREKELASGVLGSVFSPPLSLLGLNDTWD